MKQSRKKKNLNQLFCEEVAKLIKKDSKLILEDDLENGLRGDLSDKNLSPAEADFENQLQSEVDNIDTDEYNQEEKKLQAHIKQRTEENNELLAEWVRRVNEFIDFINNPQNPGSIKSIVNNAMPGSTLEKIKKTEARRLTRVSTEAAALSQALNSYIGAANEVE